MIGRGTEFDSGAVGLRPSVDYPTRGLLRLIGAVERRDAPTPPNGRVLAAGLFGR